jgi:hypothetical protein
LKTKNVCARLLIAIVFPALTLGQTLKPIAKSTDRSQADLRYAKAIELIRDTATEATLWDDKRMAIVVLSNAADLLWDDSPAQSAKWLTKAWDLAEQTSDSPRDDRLKEFFSHSVKGELRTVVLGVARKHDAHLAESFLTHLAEQKCLDEKKERGAFDDRTARSEQLLSLALQAMDSNPALAADLAARSLADGLSYNLQNVLTGLRSKDQQIANRLFDLALARFSAGAPDPSEADVLAGYLFQSGFAVSAGSTGQPMIVVNPSQQNLPAVAPQEPQRARNFLVAVYQVLLARPALVDTPETRLRSYRLLVLGERLTEFYNAYAPDLSQPAQGFLAQLQRQLNADGDTISPAENSRPSSRAETSKNLTGEEFYNQRLKQLEEKADNEQNAIARKLIYAQAAIMTKADDYERGRRIAQKIDDDNLRADTVSFVLYRAVLNFIEHANIAKANEITPAITDPSRRAVAKLALAQRLISGISERTDPAEKSFAQQRALDLAIEVERDLKDQSPSVTVAKILLGTTAVLARMDKDQAFIALAIAVATINKLPKFDLQDAATPRLGMDSFTGSGATVAGPNVSFNFNAAIDPLIVSNFDEVAAAADGFAAKELSGVARLEIGKLYLQKNSRPARKDAAFVLR